MDSRRGRHGSPWEGNLPGGRLEVAGEGKRRDQAAVVERQYWERLLHGGGHLRAIVKLSAVKLLGIYK